MKLSFGTAPDLSLAPVLGAEPLLEGLGLALDLGTSVTAAYLYDLQTGRCLGMAGAENALSVFGADLESRIRYGREPQKLLRMTSVIREQVYDLAAELCGRAAEQAACEAEGQEKAETEEKAAAQEQPGAQGRTETGADARKHRSTAEIRYVSIAGNTVMQHIYAAMPLKSMGTASFRPLSLFGEQLLAEPVMYYCPCISASVGGDTTAGILSTGIADSDEICLLADFGAGCGLALGNHNGFLCCSVPAGPVFKCAEETKEKPPVTGKELRGLQPAGAAVRGTVETMLRMTGIPASKVGRVLMAGGFGMQPDAEAALSVGMFPEEFRGKTEGAGNSAGRGACMALRERNRNRLREIAALCRYEELSASAVFQEK